MDKVMIKFVFSSFSAYTRVGNTRVAKQCMDFLSMADDNAPRQDFV